MNHFWDAQHGGAFWRLDDTGRVLDDSKKIYGQAFYIYALAEYYRAFAAPAALVRARELFELIERHAHDSKYGGYLEVRRRDWSEADASARLSDKDMNEKKSMNNHLHLLEAYTNLYRIWQEPRVEQRLHELIRHFRTTDSRRPHAASPSLFRRAMAGSLGHLHFWPRHRGNLAAVRGGGSVGRRRFAQTRAGGRLADGGGGASGRH